jgi:hypothetical protein
MKLRLLKEIEHQNPWLMDKNHPILTTTHFRQHVQLKIFKKLA